MKETTVNNSSAIPAQREPSGWWYPAEPGIPRVIYTARPLTATEREILSRTLQKFLTDYLARIGAR
jgi:hypothetical protein